MSKEQQLKNEERQIATMMFLASKATGWQQRDALARLERARLRADKLRAEIAAGAR